MTTSKRRSPSKALDDALVALARLERSTAPQAFNELLELLNHEIWTVRKRAAAALANQGPAVVEQIKARFLQLSEHQRYWSIRVIARILGAGCLSWLKQLYRSPNPGARGSVISAVSEISGEEATEFLFQTLADDAWPNRYAAAEHLERRGKQILPYLAKGISEGPGDSKYWSLRLLVRVLKHEGFSLLSHAMEQGDQTLRYYAIRALGESDEDWALESLSKALADPSWPNRQIASHILRQKGKQAVGCLMEVLKSSDHDRLFWALRTLGEIGDERVVSPVARLLARTDLDPEVKDWVVDALAGVKTDTCAKRLIEIGADEPALQSRIEEHLKGFGVVALRPLLRYLKSGNSKAREFSILMLKSLGVAGVDQFIADFDKLNPTRAELLIQGLKRMDPRMLEEMLKKGTATVDRLQEIVAGFSAESSADASAVFHSSMLAGLGVSGVHAAAAQQPAPEVTYPVTFNEILGQALDQNASDIHLRVGCAPVFRIQGVLSPTQLPTLSDGQIRSLLKDILSGRQLKAFEKNRELDMGHEMAGVSRFRVNVFSELSGIGVVARVIPSRVPSLTDLSLPPVFQTICSFIDGLVLVTGPTGSGKSTTLAAMIDYINETRDEHILTIEDPVEFRHQKKKALISYRELGKNTRSFSKALRSALREDPDVILVGELRDRTTINLAIRAAETGHLVLGTLHTSTAAETVDRILNVFPAEHQDAIRTSLGSTLKAIICQHLVPSVDRKRVAALEILLVNYAVANLIRESKLNQIDTAIIAGRKDGMISRDEHLAQLARGRYIMPETAMEYAHNKQEMEKLLRRF
ncbi:MAG: PilT/PilU family type 4a pilus ATPase [Candidatus Riflebacteria bacterium]|nr:PilT/PilU family type 4a pilus ATPase [Candidatus Riflebacteria bacterium]